MTGVYLIKKSSTLLDSVVTAALLSFLAFITYRVSVGLHYHWDWGVIPNYLLRWDEERRLWKSEFAGVNELPAEIRGVFEKTGYG